MSALQPRSCAQCGDSLAARHPNARYCSPQCRQGAQKARASAAVAAPAAPQLSSPPALSRVTAGVWAGPERHDPWNDFALLAAEGWRIERRETEHVGETWFSKKVIVLSPGLTGGQLRSVLQHEVIHAERGQALKSRRQREEQTVRTLAARRLINPRELVDSIECATDAAQVLEDLEVTERDVSEALSALVADRLAPASVQARWVSVAGVELIEAGESWAPSRTAGSIEWAGADVWMARP